MTEARKQGEEQAPQAKQKKVLLLQPPYGDLTYPYHALAYVASAINAAGYETDILDLNALWLNSLLTPEQIDAWDKEVSAEINNHYARPVLDIAAQDHLADLIRVQAICRDISVTSCKQIFQGDAFYDPAQYNLARRQFRMFEALLSHFYAPLDFFTAFSVPPHISTASHLMAMVEKSTRLKHDLASLLRQHATEKDYLFIGVGMPFSANIAGGFALLDTLADVFPGTPRIAGGTAVTDLVKYARGDQALAPLARYCDAIYVGEAETGMAQMIDWLQGSGDAPEHVILPAKAKPRAPHQPTYVSLGGKGEKAGRFKPFDWENHPPRFDWVDWSLYLSPERRVNYAPVRGCFWNKCTFCDYGLNSDRPTAPSRTMNAKIAVKVVRDLAKEGVTFFYISSDALPPNFLKAFAEELIEQKVKISWACQLFLTKTFTPDFVALLERSGLVQASFGLESGSARVLDMMGKGTNRVNQILKPAFEAFRGSGIALQPLFFMGFPGETDDDRQQTVDLLLEYRDIFTPISRGGMFTLLAGSILAKNAEKYGLSDLEFPDDDTFSGALNYRHNGKKNAPNCDFLQPFNDQLPAKAEFERPWVGGIDTFHTHLYVEKHGRTIFEAMRASSDTIQINIDHTTRSPYDIPAVIENVLIHRVLTCPDASQALPEEMQQSAEELIGSVRRGQDQTYRLSILPYRELH